MSIPLVRGETLASYLTRLAAANHLSLSALRAALGMPSTDSHRPDLQRLSAMTGQPSSRLSEVLVDACPPPGRNRMSPPRAGRLACRRCTISRGIPHQVWCVNADQRVCHRHRRWLGGLIENTSIQHDLSSLPDVVHAQRRHYRLLRRHGPDRGRTAIGSASHIVAAWSERGHWSEHRHRRLSHYRATSVTHPDAADLLNAANYPEVVTLAGLLASDYWREIASADRRRDRLAFEHETARRLNIAPSGFGPSDPLVSWQEGQAVTRRTRLHQQPGYHGLEVWLSLAGE